MVELALLSWCGSAADGVDVGFDIGKLSSEALTVCYTLIDCSDEHTVKKIY